jgi:hypothetical protein
VGVGSALERRPLGSAGIDEAMAGTEADGWKASGGTMIWVQPRSRATSSAFR